MAHACNLWNLGKYQAIGSTTGSDMTRNAESMPVECRAGLGVFGRRTSGLVLQLLKLFGISSILLLTPNPAQRPSVLSFSFCYVKLTTPYIRCLGRSSIEFVFTGPQLVPPLNGHNGNKVRLTFCGRLRLSLIYSTCLQKDSKGKEENHLCCVLIVHTEIYQSHHHRQPLLSTRSRSANTT